MRYIDEYAALARHKMMAAREEKRIVWLNSIPRLVISFFFPLEVDENSVSTRFGGYAVEMRHVFGNYVVSSRLRCFVFFFA